MARERMTNVDAAWLHMDRAANQMVITALLWFDESLDPARWRAMLQERLIDRYPRFRQRVVEGPVSVRGPRWEDDPSFDLRVHLHRLALPNPGGRKELEELVADLMAAPLDRHRPLWDVHLVDGYGTGSAVVARVHHCLADGIALAHVLLSLTDEAWQHPEPPSSAPRHGVAEALAHRLFGWWSAAQAAGGAIAQEALALTSDPRGFSELVSTARQDARAVGKLLFLGRDSPTALKGDLGPGRRVAWADPIELDAVKAIAKASGATVNDVLLAAVSGALHTYLDRRHSLVDEIRASVPVNLRPLDQPLPRTLGNHFGLVFVPLPVGLRSASERLAAVKRNLAAVKSWPEAALSYGVLAATGLAPREIERMLMDVFTARVSAVMTNLPGPPQTVHLAGAPLRGLLFWAPRGGSIAITVSIFSYAGEVTVGVGTDAAVIPDPDRIAGTVERELAELAARPDMHGQRTSGVESR